MELLLSLGLLLISMMVLALFFDTKGLDWNWGIPYNGNLHSLALPTEIIAVGIVAVFFDVAGSLVLGLIIDAVIVFILFGEGKYHWGNRFMEVFRRTTKD